MVKGHSWPCFAQRDPLSCPAAGVGDSARCAGSAGGPGQVGLGAFSGGGTGPGAGSQFKHHL